MEKKTVVELRAILKENGLPTTGVKSALIERIKENGLFTDPAPKAASPKKRATRSKASNNNNNEEEKEKEDKEDDDSIVLAPSAPKKSKSAWKKEGTVLVLTPPELAGKGSEAIIGFDMDDTIITTKSGKVFATNKDDWQWMYPSVPTRLRELHEKEGEKKKIVIFTNQGGINGKKGYDKAKEASILGRIEAILAALPGVPIQVFVATTDDEYKKPATGMWDLMVSRYNGGVAPDLARCTYVGDAAGRPAAPERHRGKKDFSCSDRKFAHNVGMSFATPEEFFLGEAPADFDWDAPDLTAYTGDDAAAAAAAIGKEPQEMVVFVGFPASGKSTFCIRHFVPRGYVQINRDTLKTQDKCMKAAEAALAQGKSVVIDNTNPSQEARAPYLALAKKVGVPARCFRFDTDEKLAVHLNYFRERISKGASPHVPTIGYCTYKKKFVEPTLAEGFNSIVHIKFIPKFDTEDAKKSFALLH